MTPTNRCRPLTTTGTHVNTPDGIVPQLTDDLDWWESPALAYWQGLQDGARLALEDRYGIDIAEHRAAVAHRAADDWQAARRDAA